jgi:hypothetical protein
MSVTRISIDTPYPAAADQGDLLQIANQPEGLARLARFIEKIAGGGKTAKVRLNTAAVQAEGQVAFDSFVQNDTVTINGVVFTGRDTPTTTIQFAVGASDEACANNFYEKLKASALDLIVGVITPFRRGTILLSSFVADDTVTINKLIFVGKASPSAADPRQFLIGSTDALTAANLLAAIQKCQALFPASLGINLLAASVSSATITLDYDGSLVIANSAHATLDNDMVRIRAIAGGQAGNLCTLAISAHGSVSAAALTGGTEGTETVFAQSRSIL